jgi:hypothetical protein
MLYFYNNEYHIINWYIITAITKLYRRSKRLFIQLDIAPNVEQLYMSDAITASTQTKGKWSTMPLNFMHDYEICQSDILQYRNINEVSLYVQNANWELKKKEFVRLAFKINFRDSMLYLGPCHIFYSFIIFSNFFRHCITLINKTAIK